MSSRPFIWTAKRDRELMVNRRDEFTYRECARMIGAGCSEDDARARMTVLRRAFPEFCGDQSNHQGECGTAREASTGTLSGVPSSQNGLPDTAAIVVSGPIGGSMAQAGLVRKALIPLPRYGEMEKRFNPHLMAHERGQAGHDDA